MQRQQVLKVFPKNFSKVEIWLKFDDIGNFFFADYVRHFFDFILKESKHYEKHSYT